MLRGPFAVTGAAWPGRVAQALKVQDNAMVMLQLRSPSLGSEAVRIMRQELAESQADERVHSMAIRPVAPCIAGSDIAALHLDTAESRSDHFDSIAHLCCALGESEVRRPDPSPNPNPNPDLRERARCAGLARPAARPPDLHSLQALRSHLTLTWHPPGDLLTTACLAAQVPVVAMLDGNLQGPALGIAAHARFSVVTDRTRLLLAGPEFGFLPESFATHQVTPP